MLPEGWRFVALGECIDLLTGFAFSSSDYVEPAAETIRLLRGDNITPNGLRWNDAKNYPKAKIEDLLRYQMEEGDIVIALDRPIVGAGLKCCTITSHDLPCLLVQRVARLRAKIEIHQAYLAQQVQASKFIAHLLNQKTETAVPHISPNDIKNHTVAIPPLVEQKRIADILQTWSDAIAATERLLANSRRQKQALMQQLLTGKRRLQKFVISNVRLTTRFGSIPADWRHVPIERVAQEFSSKNSADRQLPVLSCTKYGGLVDSLSYFNKQVFSQDVSTYKLVERGCFAYATNHIDEGSIGYQNLYDEALISPMYTVFKPGNNIDHGFLFKLMKTEHYRQIFAANTNASVDRRGSLRWGDFKKIEIPLPSMAEQAAISGVIDSAQLEVESLEKQLEKLKEEERALMQQLLTGKRRVRLQPARKRGCK